MNVKTRLAASAALVAAVLLGGGLVATPAFAATTAPIVDGPGFQPMAVAFNSSGSNAYVVDNAGYVFIDSTSSKAATHQIATENTNEDSLGQPTGGALSPDGKTIWIAITGEEGGRLFGYSTSTRALLHDYTLPGAFTGAVAISPDGTTAYVVGWVDALSGNELFKVALSTGATSSYDLSGFTDDFNQTAVVVSPDSKDAYVTTNNSILAKYSVASDSVSSEQLDSTPLGLAISSNGDTVYAAEINGEIQTYNTTSDTVASTPFATLTGVQFTAAALTRSGSELVATTASTTDSSGKAYVYSTSTGDKVSQTDVGSNPWALAVSPTGTTAYVANEGSGTTSIVTLKDAAPAISSHVATATGTVNVAYSTTWSATGFPSPTYSSTGTLPTGLTLDSVTGKLSGTPTATGVFTFKIVASNSSGKASTTKIQTVTIGLQLEAQMVGISGTPKSGHTLTASTEPWAPAPVALTYKWQRSTDGGTWTTISGATKSTYKLGSSSNHHQVRVEVTGKKTDYTTFTYKSEPVTVS